MKIGIMTLWGAFDNYGQQLQVFSLQHYLRSHGFDAYIIRYLYKKDVQKKRWYEHIYTLKYLFDVDFLRLKLSNRNSVQKSMAIDRHFDEFAQKHIAFSRQEYKTISDLQKNPPSADVYIVGSDQVWNYSPQYRPYANKIRAFFLDFGSKNTVRIAYAASFGRERYGKHLQKFVTPFLKNFDFVSCRERQGLSICSAMGVQATLTLDPVFLNSREEYLRLVPADMQLETQKFCLVYLLNNATDIPFAQIRQLAQENNVKIVFVPGKGFEQSEFEATYPSPEEWLWYMNNAEYIITNSFHGMAFALILHKPFCVLPLAGKNAQCQNDRIYTLLSLLGVSAETIGSERNPLHLPFDWAAIDCAVKSKNNEAGLLRYLQQKKD